MRRRHEGTQKGFIYFIASGDQIKIGFATDVGSRLTTLQTGNPEEMFVVSWFPSYKEVETMMHRRFKADHRRNEWFYFSDDIQEFIDDLLDFRMTATHAADKTMAGAEFMERADNYFFNLEAVQYILDRLNTGHWTDPFPASCIASLPESMPEPV